MSVADETIGPRPYNPLTDDPGALRRVGAIQDSRDRWKYRRIMIFGAVFLLGVVLLILALSGDGDKFSAAVWAFVSLVAIYIGAPVADDFLQTLPPRVRAA